ncbi:MAG: SusC/RagA family TonB-linked outer membrane protein [Bacteroidota bacterium]
MFLSKTKRLLFLVVCCFSITFLKAQAPLQVTGTVKNEKNEPIQGATIEESVSKKKTQSDIQGKFTILTTDKGTISISYVGYETTNFAAKSQLDIVLNPSTTVLTDVVVIGYGTQKKKEVTGAISTITAKDFQKGAITTPEQLIAGKVAGVTITSNGGGPGSGSVIRIRGGASLGAGSDPLIVIDGVPLQGKNIDGSSNIAGSSDPLSLINPNDIESFTVLKDAASTAIYGSRASNGVILITTKKGRGKKPVFTYSTQVSVGTLARKVKLQSADQLRAYVDSFAPNNSFKPLLGTANTDWQDEIYQTAVSTDNNLSVSGKLKNVPYRVSAGFLNQNGLLLTDYLERGTAGISVSPVLLNNHLKIDINLKGASTKTRFGNGAAIGSAVYFDPTQPVRTESPFGNYNEWSTPNPITQTIDLNRLATRNPVALLNLYRNISHVQRSYGNIQLDYKLHFFPDLHANLNLGYDIAKGRGNVDVPDYAAQNYADSGQRNQYLNKINNKVGEFYLNYIKDLKQIKSNINVIAGYGYYNNLTTNYSFSNYRYNGNLIPGSGKANAVDMPENTLISFYSRLIYTYNEKYILAASFRRDGSSKFAKDNRWGTFPSVAFTWRMINEPFLKSSKTLSDLKLRLSYGVTGNQDGIANYSYQPFYTPNPNDSTSYVQLGDTYYGSYTPSAYDQNLKWEQSQSMNIGIDFGFMNNRITGSIDLYSKKTKDMLNTIPIPLGSNFAPKILTNIGSMENKGIEFAINTILLNNKKYNWSVGFNASYYDNKITKLTAIQDSTYKGTILSDGNGIRINTVGYQAGSFYVSKQEYYNGKPVEGLYADVNNDGVHDNNDLYRYKSPTPKYVFGFSSQFSYKKLTASTVLRANVGNYMYNAVETGASQSSVFNVLGFVSNSLSKINNTNFVYTQSRSDYYIQNASFLKMDNIGLAYNVGSILKNKAQMQISFNCQNVFTVTKYTGIDPEKYNGIDDSLYPRPRTFTLGASLQF